MPLMFYPAFLYGEPGAYGVVFPDLPGCVSDGRSAQEAGERAAEALALHIEGMTEDKQPLPVPSAPDVAKPAWLTEFGEPAARLLVPVDRPGVRVRTNITIDQGLLARLDNAAGAEGMTRSGYIAQAVRERLVKAA